jgi:hypothetical protein
LANVTTPAKRLVERNIVSSCARWPEQSAGLAEKTGIQIEQRS